MLHRIVFMELLVNPRWIEIEAGGCDIVECYSTNSGDKLYVLLLKCVYWICCGNGVTDYRMAEC